MKQMYYSCFWEERDARNNVELKRPEHHCLKVKPCRRKKGGTRQSRLKSGGPLRCLDFVYSGATSREVALEFT